MLFNISRIHYPKLHTQPGIYTATDPPMHADRSFPIRKPDTLSRKMPLRTNRVSLPACRGQ